MNTNDNARYHALSLISGVLLFLIASVALAASTVRFSVPPWPGVQVKTEVVSQVLDALGYETKATSTSPTVAIEAVSTGDADALFGVWIPSQKSTLDSIMKDGHVVIAGTNLKDALYGIVVPDYVWKAGVHSIADLHKYPDKFGKVIYGIDAGSDGNLIVKKAIENGTYDLQGWEVMPSTTAAMLAQAGRRMKSHKWVAFLGWKPHWMNVAYHIKYLKDPKGIWGGKYVIYTIANKKFMQDDPNLARFLKQFAVTSEAQSKWIYDYSFEKIDKAVVAKKWITAHKDVVDGWLEGVKTTDGKPASAAIASAFKP